MARPRRPRGEVAAVRAAATGVGSANARAQRLARKVIEAATKDIDARPEDRVSAILERLGGSPVIALATDPEIDIAGLVTAERIKRFRARSGRRIPEAEWAEEDRLIGATLCARLARRYRAMLAKKLP